MTEQTRWEDPPPRTSGAPRGVWIERLRPLMEHPNRWAIVAVKPNAGTAAVLAHALATRYKIPPGRWEFVSRTINGEHRVYGRYLGSDEGGVS
jgi:hypothetical protein